MYADSSLLRQLARKAGIPVCEAALRSFRYLHEKRGQSQRTLLAVSANSETAVRAALAAAREVDCPIMFAATLNQVDTDGGYTGWDHARFVRLVRRTAQCVGFKGLIVLGVDHAGCWCKDKHAVEQWSFPQTMHAVKSSLTAAIQAGYDLIHIDPTIDIESPSGAPAIDTVVTRTVDLLGHCEKIRKNAALPPISYEVGTEEIKGGLADVPAFRDFLAKLRWRLMEEDLNYAWPCFIVGRVGTNLYTTEFNPQMARTLVDAAGRYGLAIKGHYTDNASNPEAYPESGVGGANVGPEFTEVEYKALLEMEAKEKNLKITSGEMSNSGGVLRDAIIASGRWKKWLQAGEQGKPFHRFEPQRQQWLLATGARYVWSHKQVKWARAQLYKNLLGVGLDADAFIVNRVKDSILKYCRAFNLVNTLPELEGEFRCREKLPFWGRGDIVCAGELIVEIMRPGINQPFGKTGRFLGPFPSGAPAICVDAAAKTGKHTGFVGSVGKDGFGQLLRERLAKDGVDTRLVKVISYQSTGCAFIAYAEDSTRNFIFHINGTASDRLLTGKKVIAQVASFRHCHLMGCSLLISKSMRESCLAVARVVKQAGGTISLDPNLRPELLSVKRVRDILKPVVEMADIVLPSGNEAILLTGEEGIDKACNKLLEIGVKIVVLKLGEKGCRVYIPGEILAVPGFSVNSVDPTGAGDCFDAGFIAGYLDGLPLRRTAEFANAIGALGVTRKGPMEGTFPLKEVMAFIRYQNNNK